VHRWQPDKKKIDKENDRDAGSGSTPSTPKVEKKTVGRRTYTEPPLVIKPPKPQKMIEIEVDARSDLSNLASEFEDSITSNAKSDLTGSHSHPNFLIIEKNRDMGM